MKIILNVDAISAPLTGIGTYTLQLARGLHQRPEIEELRLFSAYRWVADGHHALQVNRKIATLRRIAPFKRAALEGYTRLRAALFLRGAAGLQDHLLHSPNFVLMPFDGPAVATVHDISYLRYPQHHPIERVRFLERHLPPTLVRADALIVDSFAVRDELVSVLGVDASKLHVVPLGVDVHFHPRPADVLAPVLAGLALVPQRYLLAVATQEPRKNLERLVLAYSGLPKSLRMRLPLVIAGARGWLDAPLRQALEPLEAAGEVRRLGYLDDETLAAVYAGALGFALPSLYEGFGLPALEAMASGVPVLTSNSGALAEVGHGAALLVDPLDVDAIRAGLLRLMEDEAWRGDASKNGLRVAAQYGWPRCIAATLDVYRIAIARAGALAPARDALPPPAPAERIVGVVLVNHNTADRTLRCVDSLQPLAPRLRLIVVDSGSRAQDLAELRAGLAQRDIAIELIASPVNIGFAAGCNRGIVRQLAETRVSHVLLLNNDAVAAPALVGWIDGFVSGRESADLAGGRVLKLHGGDAVDSLGIAFYRSLLASNRLDPAEPYFGPTGGCAIYSRRLLDALTAAHGSVFDEEFFCYAEDTDVAARALLLGFTPEYCDEVLARHEGQASSGGGFNDFVLYHGIRNSIWMLAKCVPASLILRHLPWLIAMHAGIILRHSLRGKGRVVLRLYRDALRGLPRMWRKRRRVVAQRRITPATFAARVSRRFYDRGYLRNALRELWAGAPVDVSPRD